MEKMSSLLQELKECRPCIVDMRKQIAIRWSLLGITGFSMIFTYVALFGCQFLVVKDRDPNNEGHTQGQGLGFYYVAQYDSEHNKYGCLPYLPEEFEAVSKGGAFGAGRFFAVVTLLAESIAFLAIAFVMLFLQNRRAVRLTWRAIQALILFSFFTQVFTFSIFAAEVCSSFSDLETDCDTGASSQTAAINVSIIVALMFMSFSVPPPPNPVFKRWEDGDIELHDDYDKNRNVTFILDEDEEPSDSFEEVQDSFDIEGPPMPPRRVFHGDEEQATPVSNENIPINPFFEKDQFSNSFASEKTVHRKNTMRTMNDSKHTDGSYHRSVFNKQGKSQSAPDVTVADGETCRIIREEGATITKITKEITHIDGSKTITVTLEPRDDEEDSIAESCV